MGFLQINPASYTATATMLLLLVVAAMVHHGVGQPQPAQLGQCVINCGQRTITCAMQCGAAAVLDSVGCLYGCATNSGVCATGCMGGGVNPPAGV